MKSNPSEAPSSGVSEKPRRRTLAQAASQLARSMMEGTLGGGSQAKGERGPVNSAAASVHRLRKVLERDRVNVAAHDREIPEETSVVARPDHHQHGASRTRELTIAPRAPSSRVAPRVPPPPPRRAEVLDFDVEELDACLSVHDEPTRIRTPPTVSDRRDARAAALAAAAASAFGSTSASGSPRRQ